jgi:hypothetical protein
LRDGGGAKIRQHLKGAEMKTDARGWRRNKHTAPVRGRLSPQAMGGAKSTKRKKRRCWWGCGRKRFEERARTSWVVAGRVCVKGQSTHRWLEQTR